MKISHLGNKSNLPKIHKNVIKKKTNDPNFLTPQNKKGLSKTTPRHQTRPLPISELRIRFWPLIMPLLQISLTGSVWTLVGVSFERYGVICGRFKAPRNPLKHTILCYVLPVSVFAVLFNVPRFFEFNYEHLGSTSPEVILSTLRTSPEYIRLLQGVQKISLFI